MLQFEYQIIYVKFLIYCKYMYDLTFYFLKFIAIYSRITFSLFLINNLWDIWHGAFITIHENQQKIQTLSKQSITPLESWKILVIVSMNSFSKFVSNLHFAVLGKIGVIIITNYAKQQNPKERLYM